MKSIVLFLLCNTAVYFYTHDIMAVAACAFALACLECIIVEENDKNKKP